MDCDGVLELHNGRPVKETLWKEIRPRPNLRLIRISSSFYGISQMNPPPQNSAFTGQFFFICSEREPESQLYLQKFPYEMITWVSNYISSRLVH